jgi:late competence protein required for DNA uptake (superfamily II DNA/RNA helicase)
MLSSQQIDKTLERIARDPVTVVISPTGTGKSTLIPPRIQKQISDGRTTARVVVAVPTRVAAESLTNWIREKNPGLSIDFRFAGKAASASTSLVYSTAAVVLQDYMQALKNQVQPKPFVWDCVVIDEFHTGSIENSLILELHEIMTRRFAEWGVPVPKLILLSATGTEDISVNRLFREAYGNRLVFSTTPSNLAVLKKTVYLKEPVARKDVTKEMAKTIAEICSEPKVKGLSILAFVQGVTSLNLLFDAVRSIPDTKVLKAYGRMSPEERREIFKVVPKNEIRIVIATNVAESSITVPKVAYVVDSMLYNRPAHGIMGSRTSLETTTIPLSSAIQRSGRAGRDRTGIAIYYPMVTEEEWNTKIVTVPSRIPDIRLVALERYVMTFIGFQFNPRKVLAEAGQKAISEALVNLTNSDIIIIKEFVILDPKRAVGAENSRILASLRENALDDVKQALPLADLGIVAEIIEITELGKFWNLYTTGLLPSLVLWYWLKYSNSALMGCLVAAVMDSNFDRLFPFPSTTGQSIAMTKYNYYLEKLPDYVSDDPFTTVLRVVYDFFKSYPETLLLEFTDSQVKDWCKAKGLNWSVLFGILSSWKTIVSRLNEEAYYDFRKTLELHEVVKSLIDCLKDEKFFQLTKGPHNTYRREDSRVKCFINRKSVPFSPFGLSPNLLFLSLIETSEGDQPKETEEELQRMSKTKAESIGLFVPKVYIEKSHYNAKFLLPALYGSADLVFEDNDVQSMDVRLPIVEPEDIGLSSDAFIIPSSLCLPGDKVTNLDVRIFAMAIYPDFLPPLIRGDEYEEEVQEGLLFGRPGDVTIDDLNFEINMEFEDLPSISGLNLIEYDNLEAGGLTIGQGEDDLELY